MSRKIAIAICLALVVTGCSSASTTGTSSQRHVVPESEFITDNGQIECDNAEVQGHRTEQLPLQHADPVEQSVTCFIKSYSGPTARQRCYGLSWFTVRLGFGGYPTTEVCAGEEPKELSPHPYQLRNRAPVNLGGATCAMDGSAVTCTSNGNRGVSFTVSQTGIHIPIAPGDSVRFAAAGLAANAQVKPLGLQISADSSFSIGDVKYSIWNQQRAAGTGRLDVNSCVPACAAGNHTVTPVKFVLDTPVLACGHFFFTQISWRPVNNTQAWSRRTFGPPMFNNMIQETTCDPLIPRDSGES